MSDGCVKAKDEFEDDEDGPRQLVDVTQIVRGELFHQVEIDGISLSSPLYRYAKDEMSDSMRLYLLAFLQEMSTGRHSDYISTIDLPTENSNNAAYFADLRSVYYRTFGTSGWMFWMNDALHRVWADPDLQRQIKETVARGISICQHPNNKISDS